MNTIDSSSLNTILSGYKRRHDKKATALGNLAYWFLSVASVLLCIASFGIFYRRLTDYYYGADYSRLKDSISNTLTITNINVDLNKLEDVYLKTKITHFLNRQTSNIIPHHNIHLNHNNSNDHYTIQDISSESCRTSELFFDLSLSEDTPSSLSEDTPSSLSEDTPSSLSEDKLSSNIYVGKQTYCTALNKTTINKKKKIIFSRLNEQQIKGNADKISNRSSLLSALLESSKNAEPTIHINESISHSQKVNDCPDNI